MGQRICSNCGVASSPDLPRFKREWCHRCYTRWRKFGDPSFSLRRQPSEVCEVDGCGNPANRPGCARGWCVAHYKRFQKYGDPLGAPGPRVMGRCPVPGCDRPLDGKFDGVSYCQLHKARLVKYGSVEKPPKRRAPVVGYGAVHDRLRNDRGAASSHRCAECGNPADEWAYMGGDPDELFDERIGRPYSLDQDHYSPLCRPCHRRRDGNQYTGVARARG